jgi:hypothetical protein
MRCMDGCKFLTVAPSDGRCGLYWCDLHNENLTWEVAEKIVPIRCEQCYIEKTQYDIIKDTNNEDV